ncbi:MAG: hypothetical protein AAB501_02130 [Patescibacteria group bacterium]
MNLESSFERSGEMKKEMSKEEELELRNRVIGKLEKKEEERFAERENKTLEENRGQTFEQRDEETAKAAALWNLREQLAGKEEFVSAEYGGFFGKLIKGSEKTNIIEGKPIPQLIEEIEAYIARDREELRLLQEAGEKPSRILTRGLSIQEKKRELIRELTGL